MIIVDIDGIDKGLDQLLPEQGIIPIGFSKTMQEEQDAIMVQKLGLGIT